MHKFIGDLGSPRTRCSQVHILVQDWIRPIHGNCIPLPDWVWNFLNLLHKGKNQKGNWLKVMEIFFKNRSGAQQRHGWTKALTNTYLSLTNINCSSSRIFVTFPVQTKAYGILKGIKENINFSKALANTSDCK